MTGNRYYRLREFEKAVDEYKAGSVREDAPVFYYNLGQCYRQLGRHEDALWYYERFLARGKPTGQVEAVVKKLIDEMKGEIEKQKLIEQPPVEPAPAPAPRPDSASPGQARSASPPSVGRRRGMPLQRRLAIGVGAAGAATMALGVVLGLRAESFEDDAAAICPTSSCARWDEATRLIDRGKTNALYANVAFGVGGAALIGAAVLWVTGAPRERTVIAPRISRPFTGVTATMRF